MTTDTSERGLETRICTVLAGHPCEPVAAEASHVPTASYGGVGGLAWNDVRPFIAAVLEPLADLRTILFEPSKTRHAPGVFQEKKPGREISA